MQFVTYFHSQSLSHKESSRQFCRAIIYSLHPDHGRVASAGPRERPAT